MTHTQKYAVFTPVSARFVRLTALTESGNRGQWSSAAEIQYSWRGAGGRCGRELERANRIPDRTFECGHASK